MHVKNERFNMSKMKWKEKMNKTNQGKEHEVDTV
jgi:hypothetical protein